MASTAENPVCHFNDKISIGGLSFAAEITTLLGPETPSGGFLQELLSTQCRIAGAAGGVLMHISGKKQIHVIACYPPITEGGKFDIWVSRAAKDFAGQLSSGEQTLVCPEPMPGNMEKSNAAQKRARIVIPIRRGNDTVAAAAFLVPAEPVQDLKAVREKLELTPFLLNFNELRLNLVQRQLALNSIGMAVEVLSALNRTGRFMSAAMSLCNEMATRWLCSRVSIGFLKGCAVQIRAVSHTEKFNRKMRLLQDLESVMEECLDQDLEILFPAGDNPSYVCRAASRFSNDHGPVALVSMPLRYQDEVHAVLTLERPLERSFSMREIEAIRLTADLCAPRLVELNEQSRWIGARLFKSLGNSLETILKPKHTPAKLSAVFLFLVLAFLVFARGPYRIEAPFLFETTTKQAVVAPFDSYIKTIAVEPGDHVLEGKTLLGELEISELRLELAALKAEQIGLQKQAVAFMRDQKTADAQIALAQQEKAAAQISLLEARIGQGLLIAPMSGQIISQDLKSRIGAPVETGTILFEIAPLTSLQATLYVPEDAISDVTEGQEGTLVSVGHPSRKIPFLVKQIHPVAEVVHQRNVFKVRAELQSRDEWMRPGMEGIAKISVGHRSYLHIGTRRLINWLRMKLWI